MMTFRRAPFVSPDDFEEGEISAPESNEIAVLNTELHANDQSQNIGDMNLTLHNSFELLESGSEHVIGEAKLNDEESIPILLDMQIDKNPIVEDNSLGKEKLTHNTNLENPGNLVKRNSNIAALSPNPLLGPVNGRQSFPITSPY